MQKCVHLFLFVSFTSILGGTKEGEWLHEDENQKKPAEERIETEEGEGEKTKFDFLMTLRELRRQSCLLFDTFERRQCIRISIAYR